MVQYNPLDCLPSSAEFPDSDDTPVDKELQNLIPNLSYWCRAPATHLSNEYYINSDNFMIFHLILLLLRRVQLYCYLSPKFAQFLLMFADFGR
ncbi:hypothetical protein NIES3275_13480 [Microchaete diplosiphon NIES-3275]|nr:hypothetical protein NIES3275_13480 [Microchaete diplosiphon NIES-3275]